MTNNTTPSSCYIKRHLIFIYAVCLASWGYLNTAHAETEVKTETYNSTVTGFGGDFDDVEIVLENLRFLRTTAPDSTGKFSFEDVPHGTYFIKVRSDGYSSTPARKIAIPIPDQNREEMVGPYVLKLLSGEDFVYHWSEDQSTAGYEYAAHVNKPLQVTYLNEEYKVASSASSINLRHDYGIHLIDQENAKWSQEHTYRLEQIMSTLPYTGEFPTSRWRLTADEVENDVHIITREDDSIDVEVSLAAFFHANPRIVEVDGRRGKFFSKRLHHAVVRFVTSNGTDRERYRIVFKERFGVEVELQDFTRLTQYTTRETDSSFQKFKPEEIMGLLTMLEEMPSGMHKIPELLHIVRRLDGLPHPLYPTAAAVAWPADGYIEFMESAFLGVSQDGIHRLVAHEKAHFLWSHLFDKTLREDWIELGGWYLDPSTDSGWSTNLTTQFVSAYAHLKNPNEDMAESIADFIVNPDVLKSRAIKKYEFVRDRIMQGTIYLSKIREDLTFEVYNLYPDYVFPGKIKRVDILVSGEPTEDKYFEVEVELHALDNELEGATKGYTRLLSDVGTFFWLWLYPRNKDGEWIDKSTILAGTKTMSQYLKAGYWVPEQITLVDEAGNRRYQRTNDFGWKQFVDNENEDYLAPEYVPNSAKYTKGRTIFSQLGVDYDVQTFNISWEVLEDKLMADRGPCWSTVTLREGTRGSHGEYGWYEDGICKVEILMPEYMHSGTYVFRFLRMKDAANNLASHRFLDDDEEKPLEQVLETTNPDTVAPVIDLNDIQVNAEPTKPDNPDGETLLTIAYKIMDDNSGFYDSGVRIQDPQGLQFFKWHLAPDRDQLFTTLPQNEWYKHSLNWHLPAGSAPGTWGVVSIMTQDRAGNNRNYDFTETIQIEVLNHISRAETDIQAMAAAGFILIEDEEDDEPKKTKFGETTSRSYDLD